MADDRYHRPDHKSFSPLSVSEMAAIGDIGTWQSMYTEKLAECTALNATIEVVKRECDALKNENNALYARIKKINAALND